MEININKAIFDNKSYVKRLTRNFYFFLDAIVYSIPAFLKKSFKSPIKYKTSVCRH